MDEYKMTMGGDLCAERGKVMANLGEVASILDNESEEYKMVTEYMQLILDATHLDTDNPMPNVSTFPTEVQ